MRGTLLERVIWPETAAASHWHAALHHCPHLHSDRLPVEKVGTDHYDDAALFINVQ